MAPVAKLLSLAGQSDYVLVMQCRPRQGTRWSGIQSQARAAMFAHGHMQVPSRTLSQGLNSSILHSAQNNLATPPGETAEPTL